MMSDGAKHPYESWVAYDAYWRTNVGAFKENARESLQHTVSYGQMYLKTMLVLNGGAIFLLPAFAEHIGSLWSTGPLAPFLAIASFVLGVAATAGSIAYGFYCFLALQGHYQAGAARMATSIDAQYRSWTTEKKWIPRNDTPTSEEQAFFKKAQCRQTAAILMAWLAMIFFIFGSLSGVYIVGCGKNGVHASVCESFRSTGTTTVSQKNDAPTNSEQP